MRFCLYPLRVKILFPLALLKLNPTCLPSRIFWGLIFTVQDHPSGEPHVGFKSLTPLGGRNNCRYSPMWWVALQGDLTLDYIVIPTLQSPHCGTFFIYLWKIFSDRFWSFLLMVVLQICDFDVPVKGGELSLSTPPS